MKMELVISIHVNLEHPALYAQMVTQLANVPVVLKNLNQSAAQTGFPIQTNANCERRPVNIKRTYMSITKDYVVNNSKSEISIG